MTELEKDMGALAKDMAVILVVQKGCQDSQAKTTRNVDKLVDSIEMLSHDTIYLKSLVRRIDQLEDTYTWMNRKILTTFVATIAAIAWFVFTHITI